VLIQPLKRRKSRNGSNLVLQNKQTNKQTKKGNSDTYYNTDEDIMLREINQSKTKGKIPRFHLHEAFEVVKIM
jgi:hypothetical protein